MNAATKHPAVAVVGSLDRSDGQQIERHRTETAPIRDRTIDGRLAGLWGAALVLVLAARFAMVPPWDTYFQVREGERHEGLMLGWGGLHGAPSLAMALSVPRGPAQALILSTTFAVVVFSIVVRGLTFGKVAQWQAAKNP